MGEKQLYFEPLTGLRFVAALMVFITHFFPRNYGDFINSILVEFQVGVPIFFVLSGFLIAYRYYDNVSTVKGGLVSYFVNRFIRIIPLYILITIGNWLWYELDTKLFFLNLTLMHGFFSKYVFVPLPHTWSLTVECTFYIIVPFIFFLLRNRIGIFIQTCLFICIGLVITFILNKFLETHFWGDYNYMLLLTFFGRCFEFVIGIKLALYVRERKNIGNYPMHFTFASIAVFMVIMIIVSRVGGLNTYLGIFLHNIIYPICIAWMIYGLIASKNFISAILSSPVFQLLGNSSYAFFLIHYGFWQKFVVKYMFIDLFLYLFATILLSILIYKTIEEPVIKYAKNKLVNYQQRHNSEMANYGR